VPIAIEQADPHYVAIFGADHIYRMNIREMLEYHMHKRSQATVAAIPVHKNQAAEFGVIEAAPDGTVVGGASHGDHVQGVPVLSFQLGLGFTPPDHDHLRLAAGYQFERWWYIGGSEGQLTAQGIFFRAEFNY